MKMAENETDKGQYRKGSLSDTKIPKGSKSGINISETRMNAGGDMAFRGTRGHKGKTTKGKGMNKNAY